MKQLPGISLFALGSVFILFAVLAFAYAMPSSLDGRAVLLIALFAGGVVFEVLGVRDLLRAKRLTSHILAA